jgi:hypothetical protein
MRSAGLALGDKKHKHRNSKILNKKKPSNQTKLSFYAHLFSQANFNQSFFQNIIRFF